MVWIGDIVKLFMCRKLCGHGTFLLLLSQIPLLRGLQAAAERLGHSHWGRVSDIGEGAAGNLVTKSAALNSCSLAMVQLTDLNVVHCLGQVNK